MRVCERCGGEVDDKSRFCEHCGGQMSEGSVGVFDEVAEEGQTEDRANVAYSGRASSQAVQGSRDVRMSEGSVGVFDEVAEEGQTENRSHVAYGGRASWQTGQSSSGAQKKLWQKKWREMNKQEKKKFSVIIVTMLIVSFSIFGLGIWIYVDAFYGDGASAGGFTYSDFQEIRNGMSYQQVCDILGGKGEVQSESSSMGYTMAFYVWERDYPSYANIVVCFENGRVGSKSQLGL